MSDNLTIHSTGRDSEGRFVIRIAGAVSELDCLRRIEKVVEAMRTERASLESRLAFAEEMLERAKVFANYISDVAPRPMNEPADKWLADLKAGPSSAGPKEKDDE